MIQPLARRGRNLDGTPFSWFHAEIIDVRCHERGFAVRYRRRNSRTQHTAYVDGATAAGYVRPGYIVLLKVLAQRVTGVNP